MRALQDQPKMDILDSPLFKILASFLTIGGSILVSSSMYALGVTGTYLGDYFGILMDEMVTGFPFNTCSNPMYYGSTMVFAGSSLWHSTPAGFCITAYVFVAYKIALSFEEPFTAMIYEQRANEVKSNKKD